MMQDVLAVMQSFIAFSQGIIDHEMSKQGAA